MLNRFAAATVATAKTQLFLQPSVSRIVVITFIGRSAPPRADETKPPGEISPGGPASPVLCKPCRLPKRHKPPGKRCASLILPRLERVIERGVRRVVRIHQPRVARERVVHAPAVVIRTSERGLHEAVNPAQV